MRYLVAIVCAVSVTVSLTVQEPSAETGDAVTSLLLTISERLDEMDQRLSRAEDRLTLRLDTIDSYFDVEGVATTNRTCNRGGRLAVEPYPKRTGSRFKAADICAKKYGSRLAEVRSPSDLEYVRDYLKLTLGDVKTAKENSEIRLGLRTSVPKHGRLSLDEMTFYFQGPRCIVVSDYILPDQDQSHRIWRLYSKPCSLKAFGGVLCYY